MSVPMLVLNPNNPLPAFEQLKAQLRLQIGLGYLSPGTRLPPIRQLARDLGIAPNTVVHAYTDLEQENWITTVARQGVVVNPHHPILSGEERMQQLDEVITQLLLTAQRLGVSREELLRVLHQHLRENDKDFSPLS